LQFDGLIRAEQLSRGDAEGKLITDLAGGAGNRHANGLFHVSVSWAGLGMVCWLRRAILASPGTCGIRKYTERSQV
jgi:hypothetical protein